MKPVKIGFVGVGAISGIYLENITNLYKEIEIAGVCDLIPERAENAVKKYGMKLYRDMYELFADPEVDIVLNITRPAEHFEVSRAALMAGKHVYSEKPLAVSGSGNICALAGKNGAGERAQFPCRSSEGVLNISPEGAIINDRRFELRTI